MPISINNSLPFINLHLGMVQDDENHTRMFIDTDAVKYTSNISCNLWVMLEFSEMTGEFFNVM